MSEQELFKDIADNVGVGLMVYRAVRNEHKAITDFTCTYINRAASEIIHQPAAAVLNSSLRAGLRPENQWILDAYIKVIETGEPFKQELPITLENRGAVVFNISSSRLNDGILCTFSDITEQKKAEEQLIINERKYRRVYENVHDVYYETDLEGNVLDISLSIETLSGYSVSEILGKPVAAFYQNPADREHFKKTLMEKGRITDYVVALRTKDGRTVHTSVNSHVVLDDNKRPKGIEGILRDISDRVAAEAIVRQSEQKLNLFIAQAPSSIAMLDKDLRFMVVSQRWCSDFGFAEPEALIGKQHTDVFKNLSNDLKEVFKRSLEGGDEYKDEYHIRHEDGAEHWHKWEVRPWYDHQQQIGGLLMFSENVTKQRQQQDKIRDLLAELRAINQQKDKLFSIIAHDLRGPLGTFSSLFDMIAEDYDSFSRQELADYFSKLKISSGALYQLLDDLLLWAQNQLNMIANNPVLFEVDQLIKKTITYLEPQAITKGISLKAEVDQNATAFADANMIETVIRNLVSNAIKFSHKDSTVTIRCNTNANETSIAVIDEGVGIKPEDMHKLFDKTSSYTNYGTGGEKGTGIGLDLCYDFLKSNGSEIHVESALGKGSTFSFALRNN